MSQELRIETDAGRLTLEPPDDDDDVAIYGPDTLYLNADQRRLLIDWLIRHTEDVVV